MTSHADAPTVPFPLPEVPHLRARVEPRLLDHREAVRAVLLAYAPVYPGRSITLRTFDSAGELRIGVCLDPRSPETCRACGNAPRLAHPGGLSEPDDEGHRTRSAPRYECCEPADRSTLDPPVLAALDALRDALRG